MKTVKRLVGGVIKVYTYDTTAKHEAAAEQAPESLGALIINWKRSPEYRALKAATVRNYAIYLRELENMADAPVAAITRSHLFDIRDVIAEKRGSGAANLFIRMAGSLFGWAVQRGKLPFSPAARVKLLPGGHLPAWSADEADLAIKLLPEELRRVVVLARYTGQRRGDLVALKWDAYDGEYIKVTQQKSKPGADPVVVHIPVDAALRAELLAWKKTATSTHILTGLRGLPLRADHLTHWMDVELQRIGLRPELNLHGLRKLAAVTLAENGCPPHEIMAITGHSTLAMVELYTKSVNQKRLANQAIGRRQGGPKERSDAVQFYPSDVVPLHPKD